MVHKAAAKSSGHHPLCQRQADSGGQTLPQRTRGHFDRRMFSMLRVPCRGTVELTKPLQGADVHSSMAG